MTDNNKFDKKVRNSEIANYKMWAILCFAAGYSKIVRKFIIGFMFSHSHPSKYIVMSAQINNREKYIT